MNWFIYKPDDCIYGSPYYQQQVKCPPGLGLKHDNNIKMASAYIDISKTDMYNNIFLILPCASLI